MWKGEKPAWGNPSYGVESLAFEFTDTDSAKSPIRAFKPQELSFSDWTFDIFSPDCSYVALLVDHHGPIHVLPLRKLQAYLEGKAEPIVVKAPAGAEAKVHGQLLWTGPSTLEFVASCCGGAEAFEASIDEQREPMLRALYFAAEAPAGLTRTLRGYQRAK